MYAIDILVAEHENVRWLNRIMRAACLKALKGNEINTADFRKFIHIIRQYADGHHHGKEELLLFKEMTAHMGSAAEKLVKNGMLVEHDLGRLYVQQLESAINCYDSNPDENALLDILTNAMAYADLLERHIVRENAVVYPFAERGLDKEILQALDMQTKSFEEKQESLTLIAEVTKTLQELEQKYPLS